MYPWRIRPEPYHILVSEMMLQQTQASRVVPAYRRFLRRFPTLEVLARTSRADVLRAWDGLGYNRRAVALSEAAKAIVRDHDGRVPADPRELMNLPGVGPYTASAVASISYGVPVPAIDTNVRRVTARFLLGREPHAVSPSDIHSAAKRWLDRRNPGAWNQAVMDLGREACRRLPRCEACPLSSSCCFRAEGGSANRPARRNTQFDGSFRQVRGRVIAILRARPSARLETLASAIGEPVPRVAEAVAVLKAEGLLRASAAAVAGQPRGRVALAE
jgi:A/G-specific adenine glycosylase